MNWYYLNDRNKHSSTLILAANARKIPTVTLVHGVINPPYGYAPLLAKYIFCWGKIQRDQLVSMNVNPERIKIVGYHRQSKHPDSKINKEEIKKKLNIQINRHVVVLATNPIRKSMAKKINQPLILVQGGCRALKRDTYSTNLTLNHSPLFFMCRLYFASIND